MTLQDRHFTTAREKKTMDPMRAAPQNTLLDTVIKQWVSVQKKHKAKGYVVRPWYHVAFAKPSNKQNVNYK